MKNLPSTPEAQQVSDSQVASNELSLPTSNINISFRKLPISLPDSQDQSPLYDTFDLGLKDKGFRIGHLNIQCLSNKIDQLRLRLQSEKNLIHILGISETKLSNIHPNNRNENAGGGILVYVKRELVA